MENKSEIKKPKIEYPNWLPEEIREVVEEYLDKGFHLRIAPQQPEEKDKLTKPELFDANLSINEKKHQKFFQKYMKRLKKSNIWNVPEQNIELINRGFIHRDVRDAWESLYKESPEKTKIFAKALLRFNGEYHVEAENYPKLEDELKQYAAIFKKSCELKYMLGDYDNAGYHDLMGANYNRLINALSQFTDNPSERMAQFNEHATEIQSLEKSLLALGRQYKDKNGKARFFARRISAFFREVFDAPKHDKNASFVNAIFDTDYTDTSIRMITENVADLIKQKNSLPKNSSESF